MKTSVLRPTPWTGDDAFLFAVPALLLAAVLAVCALMLMLGAIGTEPAPTAEAAAPEPVATTFVGA